MLSVCALSKRLSFLHDSGVWRHLSVHFFSSVTERDVQRVVDAMPSVGATRRRDREERVRLILKQATVQTMRNASSPKAATMLSMRHPPSLGTSSCRTLSCATLQKLLSKELDKSSAISCRRFQ